MPCGTVNDDAKQSLHQLELKINARKKIVL